MNWNQARWAVAELPQPVDWSAADGLQLRVTTQQPRDDVVVALALRGRDGCWWHHALACPLVAADNAGTAAFADLAPAEWIAPRGGSFRSDDGVFHRDAVTAIALGVIDPCGGGAVVFTLTGLGLVPAVALAPAQITVTAEPLTIGDVTHIPVGVFGGYHLDETAYSRYRLGLRRWIHHTGLSGDPMHDERVAIPVTTIGDRVRPSPMLTHPDWQAVSSAYGNDFGTKAAAQNGPVWVEYWNEPYLNWANRNRACFNPTFFAQENAREGGPVHLAHDGRVCPHLRWTRDYTAPPWQWTARAHWRRGVDANGKQWSVHAPPYRGMDAVYGGAYREAWHPPAEVAEGDTYTIEHEGASITLTATTPWHVYDETQFTFWAGSGLVPFYVEPLRAFGTALKAACPQALLIVGWQHRPGEDRWAAWDLVYRPTIDATADLIDAVSDHDYGGDPVRMAAQAEVVACYGRLRHGKWLRSVNTENAAGTDPEQIAAAEPLARQAAADAIKARWCWRKIISLLALVPDKTIGCCWFGGGATWFSDQGEGVALDLLRGLRGRICASFSTDAQVRVVTAYDADAQRPTDLPAGRCCAAVLNDHQHAQPVVLTVPAETAVLRRVDHGRIVDTPLPVVAGRITLDLDAREAVSVFVDVELSATQYVQSREPLAAILQRVSSDQPISMTARVPAGTRRWLRVVVERLAVGAGHVIIGGHQIGLPAACTATECTAIREVPLPASLPAGEHTVTFTCAPTAASWLLACASIWSETQTSDASSARTVE